MAVLRPARRMRPGERFRVASVTKTFVATVVLQLVGEGRLGLDESVERHLPGLLPQGRRITVRQLLNHTSGLYDYLEDAPAQARFVGDVRPRQTVALAASRPLGFAPGTSWAYSNTGYQILGLMIERATREPLGRVLARRIFVPLDLRHTSFEPPPRVPKRVAHGYASTGGQAPLARNLGRWSDRLQRRRPRPLLQRTLQWEAAAPRLAPRNEAAGCNRSAGPASRARRVPERTRVWLRLGPRRRHARVPHDRTREQGRLACRRDRGQPRQQARG
jgi:CubicO group peptidase (beta-lactamase class C family)